MIFSKGALPIAKKIVFCTSLNARSSEKKETKFLIPMKDGVENPSQSVRLSVTPCIKGKRKKSEKSRNAGIAMYLCQCVVRIVMFSPNGTPYQKNLIRRPTVLLNRHHPKASDMLQQMLQEYRNPLSIISGSYARYHQQTRAREPRLKNLYLHIAQSLSLHRP